MRMRYEGPLEKFAQNGIGAFRGKECDVPMGMVTYFMGQGFVPVISVPLISSSTMEAPPPPADPTEPTVTAPLEPHIEPEIRPPVIPDKPYRGRGRRGA